MSWHSNWKSTVAVACCKRLRHVMREFILLAWVQCGSPTARRWRQLRFGLAHLRLKRGSRVGSKQSRVAESLEKQGAKVSFLVVVLERSTVAVDRRHVEMGYTLNFELLVAIKEEVEESVLVIPQCSLAFMIATLPHNAHISTN